MAIATFLQKGDAIDYIAIANTDYMEVIPFADCIGISASKLNTGDQGTVNLTGVFELPAATNLEIRQGDRVYWNKSNNNIDKTSSGVPAGIAVASKSSAALTVAVKINV